MGRAHGPGRVQLIGTEQDCHREVIPRDQSEATRVMTYLRAIAKYTKRLSNLSTELKVGSDEPQGPFPVAAPGTAIQGRPRKCHFGLLGRPRDRG